MFYTAHTKAAGQTYFEHLRFAFGLFWKAHIASYHFILHGITGGMYNAPSSYSLKEVTFFFNANQSDLSERKNQAK